MKFTLSGNSRVSKAQCPLDAAHVRRARVQLRDDSSFSVDTLEGGTVSASGGVTVETQTKLSTTLIPAEPGAKGLVTIDYEGGKVEVNVSYGHPSNTITLL